MVWPILTSVSLTPGPYFFSAWAAPAVIATQIASGRLARTPRKPIIVGLLSSPDMFCERPISATDPRDAGRHYATLDGTLQGSTLMH
ncbi:MAG TPA: hypothetical protein VET85_11380, partial [Stellaceae bacterium]|nr:hypothetical protein [Stellaceae bacterium]